MEELRGEVTSRLHLQVFKGSIPPVVLITYCKLRVLFEGNKSPNVGVGREEKGRWRVEGVGFITGLVF